MKEKDIYFIKKTLKLAQKGAGIVSPNPLVGAVVVKKGRIISQGFHKGPGFAHAESLALDKAGARAKGATLYLNLEPCCHFGRTPPCVDKITVSGIKRVVISVKDPNPEVNGKSIKKLKKLKVEVTLGVCGREAAQINEIFFKNMEKRLPFVTAKAAQSLDGKIATASGQSKWITSEPARRFARKLRDSYDAVLVGAETLRRDNPGLNGLKKSPYKVILSSSLDLPAGSFLLQKDAAKLIIFTSQKEAGKHKLSKQVKIFYLKETKNGLPLKKILNKLYQIGIKSIFIEGGSYTLGKFFEQRLVDKAYFFISPKIIGGKQSLTSVGASGFKRIEKSLELKELKIKNTGRDILIQGYPN